MKLVSLVCAGMLFFAGGAAAQESATTHQKTTIRLGTATPGGGFPLYGNAFAQVMNAADPALTIEPRNTKGSNENIPLLEAGQLDLALVAGEPAYEALMGVGRAPVRLKILTAMYPNPGMFVVRALQDHPRSRRATRRLRRERIRPADPVALCAGWSWIEAG